MDPSLKGNIENTDPEKIDQRKLVHLVLIEEHLRHIKIMLAIFFPVLFLIFFAIYQALEPIIDIAN